MYGLACYGGILEEVIHLGSHDAAVKSIHRGGDWGLLGRRREEGGLSHGARYFVGENSHDRTNGERQVLICL